MVVFVESDFKHGYEEVLETGPLKLRLRLPVVYRREVYRDVVFHIRAMSPREKQSYRKNR